MNPSTIIIVQFGDYRDAYLRFAAGGAETYYAQKYSVEFVGALAKRYARVMVLCLSSDYVEERLKNGVTVLGTRLGERGSSKKLVSVVDALDPDILILQSPIRSLLRWSICRKVRTLPLFADSFAGSGLRSWLRGWRLARLLNHPHFRWIANHNLPAAQSLANIGVEPAKILPWDWEPMMRPEEFGTRTPPVPTSPFSVFVVGTMIKSKGFGDVIAAVSILRQRGLDTELRIAGAGEHIEEFQAQAQELKVGEAIRFLGRISHSDVVDEMCGSDCVVVPSRHCYPEGLPMVIYEAFCTRCPLVVSDHPMFVQRVPDRKYGLVFPAGDPVSLADRIQELILDPDLYTRLSATGAEAWKSIECPLKWGTLITKFLENSSADFVSLDRYSLAQLDRVAT